MLYIIRGLPGSGKTTLATELAERAFKEGTRMMVVEADQFFSSSNGHREVYSFDARFLGAAHDECYGRAMRYLRAGYSVAVANTFSTNREISRYINGIQRCGLDTKVSVIKCVGQYNSIHNVPKRAIEKMKGRWEDFIGEIVFNGEIND